MIETLPICIVILILLFLIRLAWIEGQEVGARDERKRVVDYISCRAQIEMRQSWRDIAWEILRKGKL